jgi:hypothetical protein
MFKIYLPNNQIIINYFSKTFGYNIFNTHIVSEQIFN